MKYGTKNYQKNNGEQLGCRNCKFCRAFYPSKVWNKGKDTDKKCCVALVMTDDDDNSAYVIEVDNSDECEMYSPR